ncbi:hypothetical protein SAY87_016841 [Trapa incisa]|uniref:Uncharacterized protein n=1 Tax=Trapa incisa TaxID=236973 RepID=A0AAN7L997_9MYRT|nr:hypothetical protein SAY87_016841 [Trapa incisa]
MYRVIKLLACVGSHGPFFSWHFSCGSTSALALHFVGMCIEQHGETTSSLLLWLAHQGSGSRPSSRARELTCHGPKDGSQLEEMLSGFLPTSLYHGRHVYVYMQ